MSLSALGSKYYGRISFKDFRVTAGNGKYTFIFKLCGVCGEVSGEAMTKGS